jgi:hypothetical protein
VRRGKLALLLIPFAPLLLGGCGSSATSAQGVTPSASATSPWISTVNGSAAPSPTPSISYSSPTPFPTGFLPISSASVSPTPTPSADDCRNIQFHVGQINAATAVTSSSSATVTWYNPGGSTLVEYRVTAIAQNLAVGSQRDIGWTVIKPPATGCGFMSAPVTGLDPKTSYVFSVDAVFTKLGEDGTWAKTIARTIPMKTS